jgi:hypothetical protein
MFSDDVWEPEKLEKQVAALEAHPEYLISAAWSVYSDENLNPVSGEFFRYENQDRLQWIRRLIEGGNCLSSPTLVARKDLYEKIYDAHSGYWQLPDYMIWFKALKWTNIYVVEEYLVRQRFHESTSNISYPNQENHIRTRNEGIQAVLTVFENLSDDDFRQMYADKLIKPDAQTHLEIICEKYFIILGLSKIRADYEDIAIYYFLKYYSYEENGVYVADVMRDEYDYSYMDFRSVSASIGGVAKVEKLDAELRELRDRLKVTISGEDAEKLKEIYALLENVIVRLNAEPGTASAYSGFVRALEELLSMKAVLNLLLDGAKKAEKEMELCCKLGRLYEVNPDMAEAQLVVEQAEKYRSEIQRILA